MMKILFVCYTHGTGGEKLASEISKLPECNKLISSLVNNRTISRDIFLGRARYNKLDIKSILPLIEKTEVNEKWYVVPSHFAPKELTKLPGRHFYIIIKDPESYDETTQVTKKIFDKVWKFKFYDILEIKGQIEADGYSPTDLRFKNLKGGISYGELKCIYKGLEPTKQNLLNEFKEELRIKSKLDHTNSDIILSYSETILPNFYQTFTKSLSKSLTI